MFKYTFFIILFVVKIFGAEEEELTYFEEYSIFMKPSFIEGYNSLNQTRSKVCGNMEKGLIYFYHKESGGCYPFRERGPCPKNMVIWPLDHFNGTCDCRDPNGDQIYIYHPGSDQCYLGLTRGPCPRRQFFTLDKGGRPKCEFDPCHRYQTHGGPQYIPLNGKCYQLGEECQKFEEKTGSFYKGWASIDGIVPICQIVSKGAVGAVTILKCGSGKKISVSGKCQITQDF